MIIYLVENTVNGKLYVGQTTRTLSERWASHLSYAKSRPSMLLHFAIRKYGAGSFTIEEIDSANSREELDALEQYYIRRFSTCSRDRGYNITPGGRGVKVSKRCRAVKPVPTHCIHGHLLTKTGVYLTNSGKRICKTCVRLQNPNSVEKDAQVRFLAESFRSLFRRTEVLP